MFDELRPVVSNSGRARAASVALHAAGVLTLLALGDFSSEAIRVHKREAPLFAPVMVSVERPEVAAPGRDWQGGGSGGKEQLTPVLRGRLPEPVKRVFVPPTQEIPERAPELAVAPSIAVPPNAPLPKSDLARLGDPLSPYLTGPLSDGPGTGGGMGDDHGRGIGPRGGDGDGYGHGRNGGFGGKTFQVGGGVTSPVPYYRIEPEYSDEARQARFSGTVVLSVVIDEKGEPVEMKVIQPVGLGLDQKAIEAVKKWRFKPGTKDGKPVAVQAQVFVNFRLL